MKNPIVNIPNHVNGEGSYINEGKKWDYSTLIDATQGLEVFDLQIAALDLSVRPWGMKDFQAYLFHIKRVNAAN